MISPVAHIKLSIPNPCSENWEEMTPDERGRFCQKCAKTVIDFTILSDEEIIKTITARKGEVCGHFLPSQLSRPLILPKKRSFYIKYLSGKLVASFLLIQAFISDARAQKKEIRTTQYIPLPSSGTITIRGVLLDFETQQPVAYRRIYLNDNLKEILDGDVTDDKGNFSMKIASSQLEGAFLSFDQQDGPYFIPDEPLHLADRKMITLRLYQYPVQEIPKTTVKYLRPAWTPERPGFNGTAEVVIQTRPHTLAERLKLFFRRRK